MNALQERQVTYQQPYYILTILQTNEPLSFYSYSKYNSPQTYHHSCFPSDGLSYHDKRTVSSGTVAMDSFEAVEVRSDLFRTLHACFMVGAWICAASCGIMVARYFKKTWVKNSCCGVDQWFHLHRFFMGLTWSLTVAGVVLIVYYLNGWTDIDPRVNPHAILGVASTGEVYVHLCGVGVFI
ncbi:putative ferric-chelate reductase 1 [Chionoecetes opilio]|uniref:Putative ferric-chelate reductase 1 n=1 Tax=Chionoecetes opilio TaxID=41210 RepID=A0A8J5CMB8_CHIOP|nr:putative ferric-chelate reductase 1 [Chionoecetes opilio]